MSADQRVASASQIAKMFMCRKSSVLEAIRLGRLTARRRGRTWICSIQRADELFGTRLCP